MKYIYKSRTKYQEGLEDFKKEEIFKKFSEELFERGNVESAIEEMMRKGVKFSSSETIKGTNDMSRALEEARNSMMNKFNIREFLKEIRNEISEIARKIGREDIIEKLKEGSSIKSAISEMESKQGPKEMKIHIKRKDGYEKIENFKKKYPFLFNKGEIPKYEELLDYIDKIENLNSIIEALKSGDLDKVDIEKLKELIGEEFGEDLNYLKEIRDFIKNPSITREEGEVLKLTPKAIRKIGENALKDIFSIMKNSKIGDHLSLWRGGFETRYEESKPYEDEEFSNMNIPGTIFRAFKRRMVRGGPPLIPEDFLIFEMDRNVRTSLALLLDMSWSMSWNNKFIAAKKVACALSHLIKTKFPKDNLYIIGFFTTAMLLKEDELLYTELNPAEPFTNIQHALQLAQKILSSDPNQNKQIILITDGQPTAYCYKGVIHIEWPVFGISPNAVRETIKEVKAVTKKGIKINTFMVDDNPYLIRLIDEIVRINGGRVFYTTPNELGKYLLVDYISRKRKVIV